MGCSVHPAFVGGSGFLIGVDPALGEGDASPTSPTFCGRVVSSSLANFCSGNVLGGKLVCSGGSDGVCAFFIASSLSGSVRSQDKNPASSSSVIGVPVAKGMVSGTGEEGISLPVASVEPWAVGFWNAFTRSLLPFNSPSRSTGEGDVEPVRAVSSGSLSMLHWDFLFTAIAVGIILGGVSCGGVSVMVWLIAQRRISTPATNLEFGPTGVAGGPNGFLGGEPIVIVSMNFGWDHLCGCRAFGEDLSLFRFFVLGGLDNFAASCDSPALGILG